MTPVAWFAAGICVALGGQWLGMLLVAWQRQRFYDNLRARRMGPPEGSYGLPPDHDWRRSINHENTNRPTGEPPLKFRRRGSNPSPPRRRHSLSPQGDWMDEAFPLPPPDVMEAINRQLDRAIAAEMARRLPAFTEGQVQRGQGDGGPSTEKLPIVAKPQPHGGRMVGPEY
jgi:hypothetical protein